MQAHTRLAQASFGRGASARRRIRRTHAGNRLFCTTNGCATFMQPDRSGKAAACPVCGARRTLH